MIRCCLFRLQPCSDLAYSGRATQLAEQGSAVPAHMLDTVSAVGQSLSFWLP